MTAPSIDPEAGWLAVDWGTSRLRVWRMRGKEPVKRRESGDGMSGLAPHAFEPALRTLVSDWLGSGPTSVVVCGMAGAREGWIEAAYAPAGLPLRELPQHAARAPSSAGMAAYILPGLKQANPPDVMRGEETQLLGLHVRRPDWSGWVCLPGTHTKWALMEDGRISRFHTAMTGELFDLLVTRSVLRHTTSSGWSDETFEEAVGEAAEHPERVARMLFRSRAARLLHGEGSGEARARVSGLLIGLEISELAAGTRSAVIVGTAFLASLYARALNIVGTAAEIDDAEACTLAGLATAHAVLSEETI